MDLSVQKENLWVIRDGERIVAADHDPLVISRQFQDLLRMKNYLDDTEEIGK